MSALVVAIHFGLTRVFRGLAGYDELKRKQFVSKVKCSSKDCSAVVDRGGQTRETKVKFGEDVAQTLPEYGRS